MDIDLRNALSGLLLLHGGDHSTNDSKESGTTPTNNDSDATPISNCGDSAPISNDSMDVTPTSPAIETVRRTYKKRGGTTFTGKKASNKAKYTYQATVKPCARAAKQSANVAISALSKDTYTFENQWQLVLTVLLTIVCSRFQCQRRPHVVTSVFAIQPRV